MYYFRVLYTFIIENIQLLSTFFKTFVLKIVSDFINLLLNESNISIFMIQVIGNFHESF